MQPSISDGVLVCFEYPNKHGGLHQCLDYEVFFFRYCIDFDFFTCSFGSINNCLNIFFLCHWMLYTF